MEPKIYDVWKMIRKRRLLIFSFACVGVLLGGLIVFYLTAPKYLATASLVVQNSSQNNSLSDLMNNQKLTTTYGEIIKSDKIAKDVINRLQLNFSAEELLQEVTTSTESDSLLTTIRVTDDNPQRAVNIANAIANSFQENLPSIMKVDNVSLLDEASLQSVKTIGRPYLDMGVGLVVGLFIGAAFALLIGYLDKTIGSESELEELLGLPVLSAIPKSTTTKSGRKRKVLAMQVGGPYEI